MMNRRVVLLGIALLAGRASSRVCAPDAEAHQTDVRAIADDGADSGSEPGISGSGIEALTGALSAPTGIEVGTEVISASGDVESGDAPEPTGEDAGSETAAIPELTGAASGSEPIPSGAESSPAPAATGAGSETGSASGATGAGSATAAEPTPSETDDGSLFPWPSWLPGFGGDEEEAQETGTSSKVGKARRSIHDGAIHADNYDGRAAELPLSGNSYKLTKARDGANGRVQRGTHHGRRSDEAEGAMQSDTGSARPDEREGGWGNLGDYNIPGLSEFLDIVSSLLGGDDGDDGGEGGGSAEPPAARRRDAASADGLELPSMSEIGEAADSMADAVSEKGQEAMDSAMGSAKDLFDQFVDAIKEAMGGSRRRDVASPDARRAVLKRILEEHYLGLGRGGGKHSKRTSPEEQPQSSQDPVSDVADAVWGSFEDFEASFDSIVDKVGDALGYGSSDESGSQEGPESEVPPDDAPEIFTQFSAMADRIVDCARDGPRGAEDRADAFLECVEAPAALQPRQLDTMFCMAADTLGCRGSAEGGGGEGGGDDGDNPTPPGDGGNPPTASQRAELEEILSHLDDVSPNPTGLIARQDGDDNYPYNLLCIVIDLAAGCNWGDGNSGEDDRSPEQTGGGKRAPEPTGSGSAPGSQSTPLLHVRYAAPARRQVGDAMMELANEALNVYNCFEGGFGEAEGSVCDMAQLRNTIKRVLDGFGVGGEESTMLGVQAEMRTGRRGAFTAAVDQFLDASMSCVEASTSGAKVSQDCDVTKWVGSLRRMIMDMGSAVKTDGPKRNVRRMAMQTDLPSGFDPAPVETGDAFGRIGPEEPIGSVAPWPSEPESTGAPGSGRGGSESGEEGGEDGGSRSGHDEPCDDDDAWDDEDDWDDDEDDWDNDEDNQDRGREGGERTTGIPRESQDATVIPQFSDGPVETAESGRPQETGSEPSIPQATESPFGPVPAQSSSVDMPDVPQMTDSAAIPSSDTFSENPWPSDFGEPASSVKSGVFDFTIVEPPAQSGGASDAPTMPSFSGLPEFSNIPAASKILPSDAPTIPSFSDLPEFSNIPAESDMPNASDMVPSDEAPTIPSFSDLPEFSNIPAESDLPKASDVVPSDAPSIPSFSDIPGPSDVVKHSDVLPTEMPSMPSFSNAPGISELPRLSDVLPSNLPSVPSFSDPPVPSDIPIPSDVLPSDLPSIPSFSDIPGASDIPIPSDVLPSEMPSIPSFSDLPAPSDVLPSEVPSIPSFSDLPGASDIPILSDVLPSEMPSIPSFSDLLPSNMPSMPSFSDLPGISDLPGGASALIPTDVPSIPSFSDLPEFSNIPGVSDLPAPSDLLPSDAPTGFSQEPAPTALEEFDTDISSMSASEIGEPTGETEETGATYIGAESGRSGVAEASESTLFAASETGATDISASGAATDVFATDTGVLEASETGSMMPAPTGILITDTAESDVFMPNTGSSGLAPTGSEAATDILETGTASDVFATGFASASGAAEESGVDEETGGLEEKTGGLEEETGGLEEETGGLEEETGGLEEETGASEETGEEGSSEEEGTDSEDSGESGTDEDEGDDSWWPWGGESGAASEVAAATSVPLALTDFAATSGAMGSPTESGSGAAQESSGGANADDGGGWWPPWGDDESTPAQETPAATSAPVEPSATAGSSGASGVSEAGATGTASVGSEETGSSGVDMSATGSASGPASESVSGAAGLTSASGVSGTVTSGGAEMTSSPLEFSATVSGEGSGASGAEVTSAPLEESASGVSGTAASGAEITSASLEVSVSGISETSGSGAEVTSASLEPGASGVSETAGSGAGITSASLEVSASGMSETAAPGAELTSAPLELSASVSGEETGASEAEATDMSNVMQATDTAATSGLLDMTGATDVFGSETAASTDSGILDVTGAPEASATEASEESNWSTDMVSILPISLPGSGEDLTLHKVQPPSAFPHVSHDPSFATHASGETPVVRRRDVEEVSEPRGARDRRARGSLFAGLKCDCGHTYCARNIPDKFGITMLELAQGFRAPSQSDKELRSNAEHPHLEEAPLICVCRDEDGDEDDGGGRGGFGETSAAASPTGPRRLGAKDDDCHLEILCGCDDCITEDERPDMCEATCYQPDDDDEDEDDEKGKGKGKNKGGDSAESKPNADGAKPKQTAAGGEERGWWGWGESGGWKILA